MSHPTEQLRHAMKPSRWVLFFRTFLPYQLYRFAFINLRMLRMISMSHGTSHPPERNDAGARTLSSRPGSNVP